MTKKGNKEKPTYRRVVQVCWAVLIGGGLLLAYLMETREMAPPRKYEVNMKGDIIGVDNRPKAPVLTQEEIKEVEEKKQDPVAPKKKKAEKPAEEGVKAEDLIVPSQPVTAPTPSAPSVAPPKTDMQTPKIEVIE
ncbi:hypothetical protein [Bacteroides heparinolyticus]|uniref:hypothetical protein n=1 Tax=Prevotella heparinolytica TaxID=28113 RepID=UPI0035A1B86E